MAEKCPVGGWCQVCVKSTEMRWFQPSPQRGQFRKNVPSSSKCVQFTEDVSSSREMCPTPRRRVQISEDMSSWQKTRPILRSRAPSSTRTTSPRRIICHRFGCPFWSRRVYGESCAAALVTENHLPLWLRRIIHRHSCCGKSFVTWSREVICHHLGRGESFAASLVAGDHLPPPRSWRIMCRHLGRQESCAATLVAENDLVPFGR